MTYYIIKTHYTPTEETKKARPEAIEHDYYTGKAEFNMNTESIIWGDMAKNKPWICAYTMEHAYKRLCDVKRALKSRIEGNKRETADGHWIVTSEILIIEY